MRALAIILLGLLLASGCGDDRQRSVPRRHAYPRIEALDTATIEVAAGGLAFSLSASADTTVRFDSWVDARYPAQGITVNMSVNSFDTPDELAAGIANRQHRFALNAGSSTAVTHRFTNDAGLECVLIRSAEAGRTPLQLIATDGRTTMLSGAAVFDGYTSPADSVAPIIDMMEDELFRMLQQTHPQ